MKSSLRLGLAIVGLTLCSLPARSIAADFTFTRIADTTDGFSNFFTAPAINDTGTVAFSATLSNGSTGVFTGSGGATTPFAVSGTNSGFSSVLTNPAINNAGTVVFGASTNSPNNIGIFSSSGRGTTPIATLNNSTLTTAIGPTLAPAINNAGTIAFGSYRVPEFTPSVSVSQNGQVSAVNLNADNSTSPVTNATAPTAIGLDKAGNVVVSSGAPGSLGGGGIFAVSTNNPPRVLTNGGFYTVSVSETGNYAAPFAGAGGSSGIAIGTVNGDTSRRLIGAGINYENPPASRFISSASIDDQGRVVFVGSRLIGTALPAQSLSFFNADQITTSTSAANAINIISVGDPLFGSTVTSIGQVSARSLNNSDQVVFYAQLADGRTGIFRAEAIPEPHTVIPSVLLLGGFGLRRIMKRRTVSPHRKRS